MDELSAGLGYADRAAGLHGYCRGLMLPLERKSVEPLAAHLDPLRTRAQHQALHHFVAKSDWSDAAVLERVRQYVSSRMELKGEVYWIVDHTGFSQEGQAFGRRGPTILRGDRQAGQLPGGSERIAGDAGGERADGLWAVSS
ncbi:hypothetical protein GDR29_12510 [Xanthomonas oryzae pv. oryzae]|nr:hypothetical protein GDR29_12510 [Xanthomonas oryzae pv. oryzae]